MDELKRELGLDAVLHAGDSGVYDVVVDGELVFSKHELGRFPNEGEVVELLRRRLG